MDSMVSILLERAENEILAARSMYKLSINEEIAQGFELPKGTTFYSGIISHSYYAIFYCAKAYLRNKGIMIKSEQGEHQQVYHKLRRLVKDGVIDAELLRIYEEVRIRAESLLGIFYDEKEKRKTFTYKTIPQANKEPAEESIKNALTFLAHLKNMIFGTK